MLSNRQVEMVTETSNPACRARMEKEDLNPDNMIHPEDICELVLLPFKVSANAVPQEIVLDAMKNPSEGA